MSTPLVVVDNQTGEVRYWVEQGERKAGPRAPWVVFFVRGLHMLSTLKAAELKAFLYIIETMGYGNVVKVDATDVARHMGVSRRTAQRLMRELRRMGYLQGGSVSSPAMVSATVAWRGRMSDWRQATA